MVSTQYLTYATGRDARLIDTCEKQALADNFTKAEYKVDALVLAVVGALNFIDRKN